MSAQLCITSVSSNKDHTPLITKLPHIAKPPTPGSLITVMADFGKPKAGIPAWQRTRQPPGSPPTSTSSASESSSSSPISESSTVLDTKADDASTVAKQEPVGGVPVPSRLQQTGATAEKTSDTDASDLAAEQEFEASKATPSRLRDADNDDVYTNPAKTDGPDATAERHVQPSQEVIDQVRKFLKDPQVKDAPTEQKVIFLESKGIDKDVISSVLLAPPTFESFTVAEFQTTRQPVMTRQLPSNNLPPIVTYPEFLLQPQKPPPLVTINRLLNTAYITGAVAATLYGFSKFIVSPMTASLTEARHDLVSHTTSHLTSVNDKLSSLVSTLPSLDKAKALAEDVDDLESNVSDPTELFHRDIGTQTSPMPSADPTPSSSAAETETVVVKQEKRLQILSSHMSELLENSESNGSINSDVQTGVAEFRHYLDSMVYSPSAYQYNPGDTVWTPPGTPKTDKKDDVAASLKAEIRGVKGVLLSAKRFPAPAAPR